MRVSNTSGARQGVHTTTGLVWLNPGETRDGLALSLSQAERAARLPFLSLAGDPVDEPPAEARPGNGPSAGELSDLQRQFEAKDGVIRDLNERVRSLESEKDGLARDLAVARAEIEELRRTKATGPTKLEAKHRGGGSYSVLDADGKEVLEKLSKADAEAFNAMSAEEQAEYVKASTKA